MPKSIDRSLYPCDVKLPLQWGEMDAFGHINNIQYFRYFETARIAYFRSIDFATDAVTAAGTVGPILADTSCRFRFPLQFPDNIEALARVSTLAESEFEMEYVVWSETKQDVAAVGTGRIVCFDYDRATRVPIPDEVVAAIKRHQPDLG